MEKEEGMKNIGYKAAVISLIAILICSNVVQFNIRGDSEKGLIETIGALARQITMTRATELIEIDHFADELDVDYIYMKSIEPMGFINYTTSIDATGDTRGVRSIIYNVTFNKLSKEQANGSMEVWEGKYISNAVFTFDNAVANEFEPMQTGKLYRMYSLYRGYHFFSIIYYEEVETGKIN